MNVGQLKQFISNLPDGMEVLVVTKENSYRKCNAFNTTAIYSKEYSLYEEDFGDVILEDDDSERVSVLLID